jgi:hypothetical protein
MNVEAGFENGDGGVGVRRNEDGVTGVLQLVFHDFADLGIIFYYENSWHVRILAVRNRPQLVCRRAD